MSVIVLLLMVTGGLIVLGRVFLFGDDRLYSALEKGRHPKGARNKLEERLIRNPDDFRAQGWLLQLEVEDGDMDQAERRLSMLKIKAPDHYATLSGSCYYYLETGNRKRAQVACAKALELSSPRLPLDLNRLAAAHLLNRDLGKALPLLEEARGKAPKDSKVINNLGYYHLLANEYKKAVELFQEAIKLDYRFESPRKNLAQAYYHMKNYQASAGELRALLVITPEDTEALVLLAGLYAIHLDDREQAQKYAARAVSLGLDPADPRLAWILSEPQEPPSLPSPGGQSVKP